MAFTNFGALAAGNVPASDLDVNFAACARIDIGNTFVGTNTFNSSINFNPTTSGVRGTTTNDNASAGIVGEYISSSIAVGSAVNLTDNTAANITSISLTAGDWDVWGQIIEVPGSGTSSAFRGWINTVSVTDPGLPNGGAYFQISFSIGGAGDFTALPIGMKRISLAGTTTVYLTTLANFSGGTYQAAGFLGARRVR